MKHIAIAFLFSLLIVIPRPVKAEWFKYQGNPVLKISDNGWDSMSVRAPSVLKVNDAYYMWYDGNGTEDQHFKIGLAKSTDGLQWTKEPQPVILPTNDQMPQGETDAFEPTVIFHDGKYRLWYKSAPSETFRYAESADGIVWTKHPSPIMEHEYDWNDQMMGHPCVIFDNNKYRMWFPAKGDNTNWVLGYAESNDGLAWTVRSTPLAIPVAYHMGAPDVFFDGSVYHMYYHTAISLPQYIFHAISPDGVNNWQCAGNCEVLSAPQTDDFDGRMIIAPSYAKINSDDFLYYAGTPTTSSTGWQIGLISTKKIESQKPVIIIIPGLFGSWNHDAVVHHKDNTAWSLNPIVREYDGIIKTLENNGYELNKDLYVFAYDWRSGVEKSAADLGNYLNTPQTNDKKIYVIGHSLGGLIGRIYLQKNASAKIAKLITVGTPHSGAGQSYLPVEGGEIPMDNNFEWLGAKLLLQYYRNGLQTDRQIINDNMPVAKDLFPSYDFLQDKNGKAISVDKMIVQNKTLSGLRKTFPEIFARLQTVAGDKTDRTPSGYRISERTKLDKLLDMYPDGRPISVISGHGDFTVLRDSASAGNNPLVSDLDHGELIYSKEGIEKILGLLGLEPDKDSIIAGKKTVATPAILFSLMSPITLTVERNNDKYVDKDGLLLVPDAESGQYDMTIRGKEKGDFKIIVGQLTANGDKWTELAGTINQEKPENQIMEYQLDFEKNNPYDYPFNRNDTLKLIADFENYLKAICHQSTSEETKMITKLLNEAKVLHKHNKYIQLKVALVKIQNSLFRLYGHIPPEKRLDILKANSLLEVIYQQCFGGSNTHLPVPALTSEWKNIFSKSQKIEDYLSNRQRHDGRIISEALLLKEAEDKLEVAKTALADKNYIRAEILLGSAGHLLLLIKQ